MWIEAVSAERIAELFENYQSALGIVGPKGSECGCGNESPQPEKTEMTESSDHFARPGEAERGQVSRSMTHATGMTPDEFTWPSRRR